MSRNLRFVAPLLLIAAVAFGGIDQDAGRLAAQEAAPAAPEAPAAVPAPATLDHLVPENALAFVRIDNIRKLDAEILELVKIIEPEEVDDASILTNLGKMTGNPTLEGVAVEKPLGMALYVGAMGPMPVVIMPLSDPATFGVRTAGNTSVKMLGEFAAWAPDPGMLEFVKVSEKPSPLFAKLPKGDVALVVNVELARALIAPMLGMMDPYVDMIRQQLPGAIGEFYVELAGEMKAMVADCESLAFGATLTDGRLEFEKHYAAKEGTTTASKLAAVKTIRKSLLGYVNSADFLAMEMRGEGKEIWEDFGAIYEEMLKDAGPEVLQMLKDSIELIEGMAVGISLDGGLSETFVMGVKDPVKYEKLLDEMPEYIDAMMKGMKNAMPNGAELPMDMSFSQGETWEHAGVKVRSLTFKMSFKETPDFKAEQVDVMKKIFDQVLGGDSVEYHVAVVNGLAVAAAGMNARAQTALLIDSVKSGQLDQLPDPVASALAGFPVDSHTRFHVDVASLMKLVSTLREVPENAKAMLANPPAGLGFSAHATVRGRTLQSGLRMDIKVIATFAAKWLMPQPMVEVEKD